MDTMFISYLLTFCLVVILISYLYQITDGSRTHTNKNKNINNKLNNNNFVAMINHLNNTINNNNNINNTNTQNKNNKCMPIHRVGPVYNFHQSFGKYKTTPNAGIPTGIPEMGWRNFFLANYSNPQLHEEDSFEGIPTRHFLNNLESVTNLYRKC